MKIAILSPHHIKRTKIINGTLVQLYNLSIGFKRFNLDIIYICASEDKLDDEIIDGVKVSYVNYSRHYLLNPFLQHKGFYKKLKAVKPNFIYVRGRGILYIQHQSLHQ